MGKINNVLTCIFIIFNSVFAGFGCLLIYGLIKLGINGNQLSGMGGPSINWVWLFAISILGISILGICAGRFENSVALKVFAGFMVVGMIIMLVFGIIIVDAKNKINAAFEDPETLKTMMQDKTITSMLKTVQEHGQCCGLASAEDWRDVIPDSCACTEYTYRVYGGADCTSRPWGTLGPSRIYQKSCREFILSLIDSICQVSMGLCFGLVVFALLGLLMSILMICQIVRHNDAGGPPIIMKGY
ncbi:tetraspanin-8-like [Thalassophryne amazonica]|uniref:tetraspanin-8-like n=1 Tax=Thalassophryne amazonica TaxID=390379 RepID=UPI00147134C5|nr:tetraspanin-8-like [Thalassophryne amazonica]